jgi:hypothetical protein
MKYKINKTDEQGNHITGYEEILEGTKEECENDYRNYHEWGGHIDIEEIEEENMKIRVCNPKYGSDVEFDSVDEMADAINETPALEMGEIDASDLVEGIDYEVIE